MALGDFIKKIWQNGLAPALNATNLQKNEDKIYELDQWAAAHSAETTQSQYSTPVTETSSIIQLPSTTVKGQVSGSVKGNTATNIVKNGNFADGTTGWSGIYGTISVSNNKLTLTSDGTQKEVHACQIFATNSILNNKLFVRAKLKGNENNTALKLHFQEITTYTWSSSIDITSNFTTEQIAYGIITLLWDNLPYRLMVSQYFTDATSGNGQVMEVQEVMALDLTALGLEDKTADEINDMFPTWFDGTKSTFSDSGDNITSVGKNLFDKNSQPFSIDSDTYVDILETGIKVYNNVAGIYKDVRYKVKVKKNTDYYFNCIQNVISGNSDINIKTPDGSTNIMIGTGTFNTGENSEILITFFCTDSTSANGNVEYTNIQLEQGTTATTYEPYKESVIYPPILHSLPNGVKDEVSEDGKLIKRTKKYVLQSGDIENLYTSYTNYDRVRTVAFTDNKAWTNGLDSAMVVDGFTEIVEADVTDTTDMHWRFYTYSDNKLYLMVPKGTYTDLADAQSKLAGTTLIYQLANPVITDGAITPLTVFENGTLIVNSAVLPEITWSVPVNTKAQINSNTDGINALSKKVKDLRIYDGKLQYYNGKEWKDVASTKIAKASNTIQHEQLAEIFNTSSSYSSAMIFTNPITIAHSGVIRISFEFSSNDTGQQVKANLIKFSSGSVPNKGDYISYQTKFLGLGSAGYSTAYTLITTDVAVQQGDVIYLSMYCTNNVVAGKARNFKIMYDVIDVEDAPILAK